MAVTRIKITNSRHGGLRRAARGLTLAEVLIAMFIFLVGIVGVLAAMPAGVNSATWVIFQDAAIHLAHSKFSEFRRDRVDPAVDLLPSSGGYLPNSASSGTNTPGVQEGFNNEGDPWRDFAHNPGDPYQYFDDIWKYEWKVEVSDVDVGSGTTPAAPTGYFFPVNSAGASSIDLKRVSVTVRMKSTTRELRFSQLMLAYGPL